MYTTVSKHLDDLESVPGYELCLKQGQSLPKQNVICIINHNDQEIAKTQAVEAYFNPFGIPFHFSTCTMWDHSMAFC